MRIRPVGILCFVLLLGACQAATSGGTGLGLVVGEPTGLSLKTWTGGGNAVDAAAGWSLSGNKWLYAHVDYLHHRYDLHIPDLDEGVPYYYGVGGRVLLRDGHDSKLGVRIPLGLDYVFADGRFDVFIEVAPIINLVPDTEFDLSGGLGVRYWF